MSEKVIPQGEPVLKKNRMGISTITQRTTFTHAAAVARIMEAVITKDYTKTKEQHNQGRSIWSRNPIISCYGWVSLSIFQAELNVIDSCVFFNLTRGYNKVLGNPLGYSGINIGSEVFSDNLSSYLELSSQTQQVGREKQGCPYMGPKTTGN